MNGRECRCRLRAPLVVFDFKNQKEEQMFRSLIRRLLPTDWRITAHLERLVETTCQDRVRSGLFAGMKYVRQSYGSVRAPKLLGTYEIELAPDLKEILARPIDRVVVAGAAEGYYAVGFAMQSSIKVVHAFEPTQAARLLIHEMALANGVDEKVTVAGICDFTNLKTCLSNSDHTLVFMDIEGGEAILLDFDAIPALNRATIVVEVHECFLPGVESLLAQRAKKTHHVKRIDARERCWEDFPIPLIGWQKLAMRGAAVQLMSEWRPSGMCWFVMTPHTESVATGQSAE